MTDGYHYEGFGQSDYKITQFKNMLCVFCKMKCALRIKIRKPSQLWHDYANPKQAAELQWRISMGIATFLLAVCVTLVRCGHAKGVI